SVRFTSRNFLRTFNRSFWDDEGAFLDFEILPLEVLDGGEALRSQFYTPVRNSAGDPQRLVIGAANGVYESLDAGDTVTEIGPGIRINSIGFKPLAYGALPNPNALYLGGSDNPAVFPSNKVWVRTGAPPAPLTRSVSYPGTRAIRSIAIDPRDGDQAFVVDSGNVFRTKDAGVTWSNVTGNLGIFDPSVFRSVVFAHTAFGNALVVGTNRGVYISTARTGFTGWRQLGNAMPTVPVFDLRYDSRGDQITAGTLGRGAFVLPGVSLAVLQAD
ncbi:MAG TPA: hypothetical protein VMW27_22765, partial [Thermoanaerobaculia bacterium]|nr:hypothetical protein [Thermoanaerobaculia bacterium]